MKNILQSLKTKFPRAYSNYLFIKVLVLGRTSFLDTLQWKRSVIERRPVGPAGESIPWMNYSMVKFLDKRLRKDLRMFEYGSGYSTEFYAERVASVVSIENNIDWYNKIVKTLPKNAELRYFDAVNAESYINAIHSVKESNFDVVVVDGRYRVKCVEAAVSALSPTGVIILDDSEREKYRLAFELLSAKGFRNLSFYGLKPCSFETSESTLFYRSDNCLGI